MSLFDIGHDHPEKTQRPWLLEALIVALLLAFGAFALFADTPGAIGTFLNSFA